MAERLSIAAGRGQERKTRGGGHEWGCWVHSLTWTVGAQKGKSREWGVRRASDVNRLYPSVGCLGKLERNLSHILYVSSLSELFGVALGSAACVACK